MKWFYILIIIGIITSCMNTNPNEMEEIYGDIKYTFQDENSTAPDLPLSMMHDKNDQDFFYVALKQGGLGIYRSSTFERVADIAIDAFESLHVMNLDQQGSYLYLALGDFFGEAVHSGMAIIDVSNPESPAVTDYWISDPSDEGSAVVKVQGDYAYLGAMKDGVYVLDISNKNSISLTSQFIPNPDYPIENPSSVQAPNARGMALENNLMYLCYDAGGLRVIDISNPNNLEEIGLYLNEEITKQQAFNSILIDGTMAYITTDYCGLEVIDISDPTAPVRVTWLNPWSCETAANNWFNSDGHMNQLRLDKDADLLFVSSGKSEVVVIDVSNPLSPQIVSTYGSLANNTGVWGLDLKGEQLYLLYITAVIPFNSNKAAIRSLLWEEL